MFTARKKKSCLSCCKNISKLKDFCKRKGLTMSFTEDLKPCKKHKNDKVILIYNSYKLDKLQSALKTILKEAMVLSIKRCAKITHRLQKKRTGKKNFHLDPFTVEDITVQEIQVPQERPKPPTSNDDIVNIDDNQSDATEINEFLRPQPPPPLFKEEIEYAPREQDSLGLLNISQTQVPSQNYNRVRYWTQYGHPYVNELPESQYDIPLMNVNRVHGWVSPRLSPIHS